MSEQYDKLKQKFEELQNRFKNNKDVKIVIKDTYVRFDYLSITNKLKELINSGYKIISVNTEGDYTYYTLLKEKSDNPIVICSVNLINGKPEFSVCWYED